jgi:hypothetical protein
MSQPTEWTNEICDKAIDLALAGVTLTVDALTRADTERLRALLIDHIVARGIGARVDPVDDDGTAVARIYGSGKTGHIVVVSPEPIEDEWIGSVYHADGKLPRTKGL